jgi:hypothetical protein
MPPSPLMDQNISLASNLDFDRSFFPSPAPLFLPSGSRCSVRIIRVLCSRCRSLNEGETALHPPPVSGATISPSSHELPNWHGHGPLIPMNGTLALKTLLTAEFRNEVSTFHLPETGTPKRPKDARASTEIIARSRISISHGRSIWVLIFFSDAFFPFIRRFIVF